MPSPKPDAHNLERFRAYLQVLARSRLDARMQAKLDASDIVQQTLLHAQQAQSGFRGRTERELAAWLRQILAHNLAHAARDLRRGKRDIHRERSLEAALDASSARLEAWLAADQPSPSAHAVQNEEMLRVSEALLRLTPAQQQAIVWHYFEGWRLARIGERLEKTQGAVAGLIHRGLQQLRAILQSRSDT